MPRRSLTPHRRSHRSWLHARRSWVCRPRKTRADSSSTRNRCTSSIFSISARGRRMCACAEHQVTAPAVNHAEAANECDIKVFSCPKSGNSAEEYEAAWALLQTRTPPTGGIRVAVADGATETRFVITWRVLMAVNYL